MEIPTNYVFKQQADLEMLSTKCVYKSYIFDIYVERGFSIK